MADVQWGRWLMKMLNLTKMIQHVQSWKKKWSEGIWIKKSGAKKLKREKEERENFEDVADNRENEAGEWSVSGDGWAVNRRVRACFSVPFNWSPVCQAVGDGEREEVNLWRKKGERENFFCSVHKRRWKGFLGLVIETNMGFVGFKRKARWKVMRIRIKAWLVRKKKRSCESSDFEIDGLCDRTVQALFNKKKEGGESYSKSEIV